MTIIVFLVDTSASMNQKCYLGTSLLDCAKSAIENFLKVTFYTQTIIEPPYPVACIVVNKMMASKREVFDNQTPFRLISFQRQKTIRARDPSTRGMDRYMLLTFEDSPKNIKAGWRENQGVFLSELKNLRGSGTTKAGESLGNALQLLNINRLQSGIDNYGQGRYPHWLEPALIIVITDSMKLTPNVNAALEAQNTLSVPVGTSLGCELTREPFRWDQRVFSLILRLPGHPPPVTTVNSSINNDIPHPMDPMCDVTGGRSYSIRTHKALQQALESLAAKIQSGIVVQFEKSGPDPPPTTVKQEDGDLKNNIVIPNGFDSNKLLNGLSATETGAGNNNVLLNNNKKLNVHNNNLIAKIPINEPNIAPLEKVDDGEWQSTRRMVFVQRHAHKGYQGFWPIPESFYPDINSSSLLARGAHPVIKFKCDPCEPSVLSELPFDKCELEPSPLTLFILERKQPNVSWQVFVEGSGREDGLGLPFGYIKASTDLRSVNLIIMPYNYPVLLPLLEELRNKLKMKVTSTWRMKFDNYLRQIPPYYFEPLRKALARIGLNHSQVMPERHNDTILSYSVLSYLQRVKHKAKEEFEKLNAAVARNVANSIPMNSLSIIPHNGMSLKTRSKVSLVALLDSDSKDSSTGAGGSETISREKVEAIRAELKEFGDMRLLLRQPAIPKGGSQFRNSFDITRNALMSTLKKMRMNLRQHLDAGDKRGIPMLEGGLPGVKLKVQQAEELHELPISQMGNYQDYLNRLPTPLREIDPTPIRTHAFGNPFKIDKNLKNIDEINLDSGVGGSRSKRSSSSVSGDGDKPSIRRMPNKRKGLPKGYKYKRRRLNSETGSIVSDSEWETDSNASTSSSMSHVSADGSLSPLRIDSDFGSGVLSMDASEFKPLYNNSNDNNSSNKATSSTSIKSNNDTLNGGSSSKAVYSMSDASTSALNGVLDSPDRLFRKQIVAERKSRLSSDKGTEKTGPVRMSFDSMMTSKKQVAIAVRRPGPAARKIEPLREIWEWGVDSLSDQSELLRFAIREAERFRMHELIRILNDSLQTVQKKKKLQKQSSVVLMASSSNSSTTAEQEQQQPQSSSSSSADQKSSSSSSTVNGDL